jgi:HK97 family phage portal protein
MEEVKRINGELIYVYRDSNNRKRSLTRDEIFHVAGTSFDGIIGLSPIEYNRQSLNLGKSAERYGYRFFKNDARPSGVIHVEGRLNEEQIERMRKSWYKSQGDSNQQRVAILEDKSQFKEISISPEHAQFLETRKYSVTDIARIFGIQPHLIGDLDRATFSNIEHQSIEFVNYTMMPRFVRVENCMTLQLLNPDDRPEYYLEFHTDALLRGDIKARNEALNIQRQNGIINANEWRKLLNMNEIDGEAGEKYLVNGNMIDVKGIGSTPIGPVQQNDKPDDAEKRAQQTAESRAEATRSFEPVFVDMFDKIIRKEKREITKAVDKYLTARSVVDFENFLNEYYNDLSVYMRKLIFPNYRAFANIVYREVANEIKEIRTPSELDKQFLDEYVDGVVLRYTESSKGQLKKASTDSDGGDEAVIAKLDHWEKTRSDMWAREEITRASNGIARSVYFASGFLYVRWVTRGSENCPYCQKLNGMTVGRRDEFIQTGEDLTVNDSTMNVYGKIKHPPLHRGCDCQLVAGV